MITRSGRTLLTLCKVIRGVGILSCVVQKHVACCLQEIVRNEIADIEDVLDCI